ncbi:Na+/H+ antiporter subunit E [Occultella glacieicola]|uniref:Na+/H+ antiporter subunit E n=1 Tax=Occultella glacieicola TaxID=2518684 RepID=UPI001F3A7337|nr:Na+/H+ antiporter subunit E [Occultella glacieicola]
MSGSRKWLEKIPMVLWLTVLWVLFWGDLSLANVLAGALIGLFVMTVMPMPRIGFEGRVSFIGTAILLGKFAVDVLLASVQVARQALRFGHDPHGAVIRVPLRSHSDLYLTLTAVLCSLVPGSIIVEAHRLSGTLYVHVLDVPAAGGIAKAKADVLAQERRVLYALATDADIAEAGLPPRPWKRGRTDGPDPTTAVGPSGPAGDDQAVTR